VKSKVLNSLIILLAVLGIVFVAWVILSADRGSMPGFIAALYRFPNGDKLGHFLLMGVLAFIITLALPRRFQPAGLAVLAAVLALEEFSQQFINHRTSSWLDLICSLAGVAVFGGASLWISRTRHQPVRVNGSTVVSREKMESK
jgi:hypothetical protein